MNKKNRRRLAFTSRQYFLAAAVATVVTFGAFGGYLYYHANSPGQLAIKAQLAMEQSDTPKAVDYLRRAIEKHPGGEIGNNLRKLMARALIEGGRESDARLYANEILAANPNDKDGINLLAESHTHIAQRKLDQAPKPLTDASLSDIYGSVDQELTALAQLPQNPRNQVAQAQLHRLHYVLMNDQIQKAKAAEQEAGLSLDAIGQEKARQRLTTMKDPTPHRERCLELLRAALKQDPKYIHAAEYLVQYENQDRHFQEAVQLYHQFQSQGVTSQELVINAANAVIADSEHQPDYHARYAQAQKELEAYLAANPEKPGEHMQSHILIAIGQTLVEQGKITEAEAIAGKAAAADPKNLDAQILQINCKIRQRKTAEALALATPLTNSNSGVPQVWYLIGLCNADLGNLRASEDAYRKALALNPAYTPARRALLTTVVRAGNSEAASLLASYELRDDRYFIPAWEVTVQDLKRRGQGDRAKAMLTAFANDPGIPAESRGQLVELLLNAGLTTQAEAILAKMPPNDDTTLRLRAYAAAASGQVNEARDLMKKTIAQDPTNVEARLEYAELLYHSNLTPDARAQLDEVVAHADKTPPSAASWCRVARDYLALRLPEQALAATKQALAAQPNNTEAQWLQQQSATMISGGAPTPMANGSAQSVTDALRLATSSLAKKDYENALSVARSGLANDPTNVELHHLVARALSGLGHTDQAVEELITTARTRPDSPASFVAFVELFPTPDAASRGTAWRTSLIAINPALGNWAMGRLAEICNDTVSALRDYHTGIEAASRTAEPGPAKDLLYHAVLALHARQNDGAAIRKETAAFASDASFAVGVRLLAADHLRILGDNAGVAEQLDQITADNRDITQGAIILGIAQRWIAINRADRALTFVEGRVKAIQSPTPALLDVYAALLQRSNPQKALAIHQQLVKVDPANPQYRISLAQSQAAVGDLPTAFKTLDETRALGETGKQLARTARLRLLISLGLLREAADEISARSASGATADDFASLLEVGQAWTQLGKPDEARKALAAIPPYAAEYPSAAATLAALDSSNGKYDAALKLLKDAIARAPRNFATETQLAPALFQTYLRAGDPSSALTFAKTELNSFPANTPPYRNWVVLAAAAAREANSYDAAIALLDTLDPETRKASAPDVAMLALLQNRADLVNKTAPALNNDSPNYFATTVQLLAGAPAPSNPASILSTGVPSTVYAVLAALPPDQQKAHLADVAKNPRVISADIENLLTETAGAESQAKLRRIALAQRLLEMGWTTGALSTLDAAGGSQSTITIAQIQRHEALVDLRRFDQADKIRDDFAARVTKGGAVPPGVRIVLSADAARREKYDEALKFLEPLASLKRVAILTSLAGFHERLGQLDQAIALHREVRKLDPENIPAANNLAYTLIAAKPQDPAALAEARTAIEFAISKAPQVTAFQDTLAWIEILSNKAEEGTQRLARALPSLRLDPAVHYHLGMGYAKIGQPELARLHLQNVQFLAQTRQSVPELALASEALKTIAGEK